MFRIKEWVSRLSILIDEGFITVPISDVKLLEVQEQTKKGNYWCIMEYKGKQIRTPIRAKFLEEVKGKDGQLTFRLPMCPECSQDMQYNLAKGWYYCKRCKNAWLKVGNDRVRRIEMKLRLLKRVEDYFLESDAITQKDYLRLLREEKARDSQ